MAERIQSYIAELTGRCNAKCSFCYSISYDSTLALPKKEIFSSKEWMKGLENIVENGAEIVDFSGGEPTIHPNFSDVMKKAKELGLYVIVSTNGSTINNDRIRNSIEDYVDCLSLSVHGVGEVHDSAMKRKGSYQEAIKLLNYFKKSKSIKVNSVVSQENIREIYRVGEVIGVEDNSFTWKVIQMIPREAGLQNKQLLEITYEDFQGLQEELVKKFPRSYTDGRLVFRDDDSKTSRHGLVPYIISDSSGQLHIPFGEQHLDIGVSILDPNLVERVKEKLKSYEEFSKSVKENHEKSYGLIEG